MRIVSGKYKGKVIAAPKNLPVRPTTDFAKEGLFNILGNHFPMEEITVLDLFSGTGNIAYEFVSRGCTGITCVDVNFNCCAFIRKTLAELNAPDAVVIRSNVFTFLKGKKRKYDLIFADPPYEMENKQWIIEMIFANNMLNENGWLILEHSSREDFSKEEHFLESRNYGKVNFSIFDLGSI